MVCARGGGGLLRERMALVAALWAAGIRAELLPAAAPSVSHLSSFPYSTPPGRCHGRRLSCSHPFQISKVHSGSRSRCSHPTKCCMLLCHLAMVTTICALSHPPVCPGDCSVRVRTRCRHRLDGYAAGRHLLVIRHSLGDGLYVVSSMISDRSTSHEDSCICVWWACLCTPLQCPS